MINSNRVAFTTLNKHVGEQLTFSKIILYLYILCLNNFDIFIISYESPSTAIIIYLNDRPSLDEKWQLVIRHECAFLTKIPAVVLFSFM